MRLVPALLPLAVLACARASSHEAAASTPVIVTARPCATGDTAYFGRTARSGYEAWYGGTLRAMREPILCSEPDVERYRFLWLRSFHPPIAVRVEHQKGRTTLVAKRLRLGRDRSGSVLDKDTAFALTADEWAMLQDLVTRAQYWESPTEWPRDPNVVDLDGARWVLEAATPMRYHLVDRWSAATDPRDAAFTRLCLFLLDISGLKPPAAEIY